MLAEVVDDGDAPVLECCGDPGLAAEAFAQDAGEGLVVLGPHRLEAFDGDMTAERFVAGAPHLTHASAPDQIEQSVPALDQPGVRHRLLSPPFVLPAVYCCALPGPSSMAAPLRSLYGVGRLPGPSRAIAFGM